MPTITTLPSLASARPIMIQLGQISRTPLLCETHIRQASRALNPLPFNGGLGTPDLH
jgi:hypothetical protein